MGQIFISRYKTESNLHSYLFQYQIEQRKKEVEFQRQQELNYGKTMAELEKQEKNRESAARKQARLMQKIENSQFLDYMQRLRLDQRKCEDDVNQMNLMKEEIEAEAEAKHQNEKLKLNVEKRVCNTLMDVFRFNQHSNVLINLCCVLF